MQKPKRETIERALLRFVGTDKYCYDADEMDQWLAEEVLPVLRDLLPSDVPVFTVRTFKGGKLVGERLQELTSEQRERAHLRIRILDLITAIENQQEDKDE